ncbi:MAG: inositol monophosphatase, partial [Anaerolineae bacterium]|nr:inositol monophosphatase [Anaerolineae bacterium]
AHLACGRLDGYWEMHLRPWDWAAGWLLVEEAGGKVTDMRGGAWSLASDGLVASNGLLHAEFLAHLAQANPPG